MVRNFVPEPDDDPICQGYLDMAADDGREREATDWAEGLIGDAGPDEPN